MNTSIVSVEGLTRVPFLAGLPPGPLARIAAVAEEQTFPAGHVLLQQHARVDVVHVLLSGVAQILLRFGTGDDLLVSVLREPGALIGWSTFRAPYRATATVRCEQPSRVLAIPSAVLTALVEEDPALGAELLRRVAAVVADRFEQTRDRLMALDRGRAAAPYPRRWAGPSPGGEPEPPGGGAAGPVPAELLALLDAAPFYERFLPEDRAELARVARTVEYAAGQRIVTKGQPGTTFATLVSGTVRLSFGITAGGGDLLLQTVRHPGTPIGWSTMVPPHVHRATATAYEPTRLLVLDRRDLDRLAAARPTLGLALMRGILDLLGDRLRAARLRLVARRYDDEVAAVRSLLAENAAVLPVTSPLHKLPHYLEHRLTLDDALHTIEVLQAQGSPTERGLAAQCADALGQVRRQLELYRRLQAVYETVASAPADLPPEEVRTRSMLAFRRVFALVDYRIEGTGRLPRRPGQMFVMNHLANHPDNLLANDFTLTLDTHFVASMILFERYGAAPIRVIRRSRPAEHGHQRYYDRLGYVYTDPARADGGAAAQAARQRRFLEVARGHLAAGHNLLFCPEGTSTSTEASPLRFRPGAFQLTAGMRPEPLIVPVAVAGFDRRLTRAAVAAVVHEPFKVSDAVADPSDREALLAFLNRDLGPRFRAWVRAAAAALAG